MKKTFILVVLFYCSLHFLLPYIGYQIWGYVNLYADVQGYTGMWINLASLLLLCWIINKKNVPQYENDRVYHTTVAYFVVSMGISIIKFVSFGGYEGALSGQASGSLLSFVSMFFSVDKAFVFLICFNKELKQVGLVMLMYVLYFSLLGSRSAVIGLVFTFIYLSLFPNFKFLYSKIKRYLLVFCLVSPVLFYVGTKQRGDVDTDIIGKVILGRISFIGLSEVPIYSKLSGDTDYTLFYEKYGISNQVKQSINSISPIDFFKYDIAPNQYYRQVFLGARDRTELDSYLSINLTLPVYLSFLTNNFLGPLLTVLSLLLLFNFWVKYRNNQYVFFSILLSLYEILYFFDLVMITQNIFRTCLSLLMLNMFEKGYKILKYNKQKYNLKISDGK